ncbi:MAG: Crp/Fnr family transcriptional regulator [Porphyromonadaceae bacterium]|nr:Crp/Fnr family transcriptional regulator [Porphyromonadaceae bacterium]
MQQSPHADDARMIFQCPLCSSIPAEQRDRFLQDVRFAVRSYEKGDTIVTQGARYDALYILIRGEIVTEMADEKGDFMKVEQIRAPNPMATGFLFSADNRSPVSAVCKVDCSVIVIPKENVYFLMREYESFMLAFLSYISNKVSFLSEKLRLVSLRTIRAKIAYYLLKESGGEKSFRLKTSKESMARLFGVSRPALVKVMMEMAEEGLIDVNRRDIQINDRATLQKML